MNYAIQKAGERFRTWAGWLQSYHSFSFGHHYHPDKTNFGPLLVLNDDIVAANMGFGMHPHRDMEIITIVLSGSLKHEDSLGTSGLVLPGDVQIMSAGTGITHSEYNASATDPLSLLQIWIQPNTLNLKPRYGQKTFNKTNNLWQVLVSPFLTSPQQEETKSLEEKDFKLKDDNSNPLQIFQDAYISQFFSAEDSQINYQPKYQTSNIFFFLIEGKSSFNHRADAELSDSLNHDSEQIEISKRDDLRITNIGLEKISLNLLQSSHILAIEMQID